MLTRTNKALGWLWYCAPNLGPVIEKIVCPLQKKTKTNFICMLSPWLFSPVKINVSLNLCSFKFLMADEIITTS